MSNKNQTFFVTGASSGIGHEYARQLAAQGYDLLLTARRKSRLQAIAQEIEGLYGVNVTIHAADLANPEDLAALAEIARSHPALYGFVNNAGFGTQGHYIDIALSSQLAMLDVHVRATMILCRAALPAMRERGAGVVINVSSVAAFLPAAGNATYSATKAFLNTFSQGLAAELRGTGVQVQALCPGFTRTEFHDTPEYADFTRESVPDALWMTPQAVVSHSLAALGRGKVVVVPGWRYQLMTGVLRVPAVRRVARFVRRVLLRR